MRNRLSLIGIFLGISFTLSLDSHPAFAIGSQIGLEFAIDAPWRIEPFSDGRGGLRYGPIPIVITFHDANFDHNRGAFKDAVLDKIGLHNIHVGVLQEVKVAELSKSAGAGSRPRPTRNEKTFGPSQLTEIERKIGISKKTNEPPHEVCWPTKGMNCNKLLDITKSHEWHALLWYTPQNSTLKPGDNLYLSVTVTTIYGEKGRNWTNDLLVHAGEAPLPRFSNHWLYGDLHYHSQMTDNDGESAYSYRNVVRALGALGMDFTFTTDHASDGIQSDTNLNLKNFLDIPGADKITISGQKEARDLNTIRFGVAKSLIYGQNGANELIADDVKTGGVASYHSHGVLPQIFMGEEVDAWPGMSGQEQKSGNILFGDGLKYPWPHGRSPKDKNSCLNKAKNSKDQANCRTKYSTPAVKSSGNVRDHRSNKPFLVLDDQGAALREMFDDFVGEKIAKLRFGELFADMGPEPSRQHIVFFPFDTKPGTSTGFVTSQTTKFGGGSRKLEDLVQEITRKGRAFLAHPLDSRRPGGAGPDIIPYSESSLDTAWRSPGILGLQFWNENARLESEGPEGEGLRFFIDLKVKKKEIFSVGTVPKPMKEITVKRNERSTTFYDYQLPWRNFPFEWEKRVDLLPIEKTQFFALYHGAYTWDKYLRKGLDQRQTRVLGWLKGGPRKWYMAGGSDSHGDWNFRREGRFLPCALENLSSWCDYPVVDTAIGKPRNLVFVGPPKGAPAPALPNVKRHTNDQVIYALSAGRFSVTDGPALRIAVDRNRNGKIDDSDFQMGDTFHFYPGEKIPLIVEWISSLEFGPVEKVDVYVGNKQTTFTPPNHGVIPLGGVYGNLQATGKGYINDPSGVLQVKKAAILKMGSGTPFHGKARYFIDPRDYGLQTPNEFFYLRAFAQTGLNANCPRIQQISKKLDGTCISRLAYSNPVWGRYNSQCRKDSQALDQNGDGMPDTCEEKKIKLDPCPPDHIRNLPKGPQSQQGIQSRSIPSPTQEATSVELDKAVHFMAIDGTDVVIEPGTYHLASADTWLKVIPSGGQPSDAVVLEAIAGTHEEKVDTSLAVASPGKDADIHHLVLFLPEGKTLEAIGSYSGIRKRAVKSFSRPQMRTLFRAKTKRTTATFATKQGTPSTKKSTPLSQQVFTAQLSVFTGAKYSCQVVEPVITKPSIGGNIGGVQLN